MAEERITPAQSAGSAAEFMASDGLRMLSDGGRIVLSGAGPLLPELFPLEPSAWQRVLCRCRMTRQQAKLAQLLLYGLSDKQIASVMCVSVSTIRSHLNRLFRRTGTDDRHALSMRIIAAARTDISFVPWR